MCLGSNFPKSKGHGIAGWQLLRWIVNWDTILGLGVVCHWSWWPVLVGNCSTLQFIPLFVNEPLLPSSNKAMLYKTLSNQFPMHCAILNSAYMYHQAEPVCEQPGVCPEKAKCSSLPFPDAL
jgi:hypothetical protein